MALQMQHSSIKQHLSSKCNNQATYPVSFKQTTLITRIYVGTARDKRCLSFNNKIPSRFSIASRPAVQIKILSNDVPLQILLYADKDLSIAVIRRILEDKILVYCFA